jgi:hypothetical protein
MLRRIYAFALLTLLLIIISICLYPSNLKPYKKVAESALY